MPIDGGTAAQTRDEIRILARGGRSTRRRLLALAFICTGTSSVLQTQRAQDALRRVVADDAQRTTEMEGLLDRLARLEQKQTG